MASKQQPKKRTPRTGGTRRTKPKAEAAPLPLPSMDEFMTREKANTGHKIPLYAPDGRLTGHWFRVRGVDSDEFNRVRARHTRRVAEVASMPEEADREAAIADAQLEMHAALVADWSFSDPALMGDRAMPCTPENVKKFLREAPQIAAEVDKFASRRTFFFKTPLDSLMPSQPPSSP